MNPLYPFVESVINQGSPEALQSIITSLGQEPGQTHSEYSCGENTFYVLKRLIGASLARDPKIKEHAAEALKSIVTDVEDLKKINLTAFQDFFITTTAMTDCKTKQEKSAYIQGKLNVIKEMLDSFKKSQKILTHLVEIANQNENFQEEILEVLYLLNGDKLSGLKLKLSDSNNSQVLLDILQKKKISQQIINKLIASAIQSYPHPSIALKYLGANLENILASPQEFFKSHYAQFLDVSQQQTEDGDLKKLYYLLEIQFYFLKNVTLAPQNIAKFLCKQMVVVWLEQLRVKNKHMKKVANQMTINFNESHEFCFEVLKYLHEQKIYLENVSPNHPFDQLYRNVQVTKFWKYLNDLIKKEDEKKDEIQDQNDENVSKKQEYLSQLQYITRQRSDVLTPDQIGETLTILIHSYQQSKRSQKLLNLVWSLFHSILTKVSEKNKSKKKLILNTKGPLILSKINLTQLQLEQQIQQTLTKAIKFLRIKVKSTKQNQSSSKVIVALLNFITGLVVYSIVYPEQSDVCGEIQFIYKDLQSFLSKEQGTENDVLKKKRKKSQDVEDPKKPIHVLIQVFISLLTKAPIFLRNSINLIFEQLVPYLETSDLDTLLDVIQKPDQEYIEEI